MQIMKKPRAVIYIRVSDESQLENNSFETQEKSCRKFIESNGFELVEPVFKEEAVSAKHTSTRPELMKLLNFCCDKRNDISFVIVYRIDRWTRNTQEGLAAESLLSRKGVELLSSTEGIERNPTGQFVKTVLMGLAQLDNELKGERVKDNQITMFHNGYWCWKPPVGYRRPYGLKGDRKGKESLIDENLGPLIKYLFEEASKIKLPKVELARKLNLMNFKKFHGKEADVNLVGKIISKSFYYGLMYAPKWKEYSLGKHTPLIDEETWKKANINLFGNKSKYRFRLVDDFPLKGLIKCNSCGKTMTTSGPVGNGKVFYYECKNKKCNHQERITREQAQEQFIEVLKSIKPNQRVLKLFTHLIFNEWDKSINSYQKTADKFEKNIKDLKSSLIGISESNRKGILTDEEAKEQAEEIRKKIVVLEIEKSDVKIEQYNTEIVRNFTEEFLLNLDKLWNRIDLPKKQALHNKIFPNGITCENHKVRTINLSQSFEYIDSLSKQNSPLVTLRGIEPRLAE